MNTQSSIEDLCQRFRLALSTKLQAAEQKYGWANAWAEQGWEVTLRRELQAHVDKGDPIDVAAYCAFAWRHGWSVATGEFRIDEHWLADRAKWSLKTFGPEQRVAGVCDHLRKEIAEAEANPGDASEWADIILLALDGAFRAGHSFPGILAAVRDKQAVNTKRHWPDWRNAPTDRAIEHQD